MSFIEFVWRRFANFQHTVLHTKLNILIFAQQSDLIISYRNEKGFIVRQITDNFQFSELKWLV